MVDNGFAWKSQVAEAIRAEWISDWTLEEILQRKGDELLEWTAQGGGGVTVPEGV